MTPFFPHTPVMTHLANRVPATFIVTSYRSAAPNNPTQPNTAAFLNQKPDEAPEPLAESIACCYT
jgi:hypothetical protein